MNTNNPYDMPNAYETGDILTGYQKNAQEAELGRLKLEETKRQLSEAELARKIKTEAYKGFEAEKDKAVAPVGFAQPVAQPQAAPGSTAFWQGQNTAAPAPEVQAEQEQARNHVKEWRDVQQNYNLIATKMQENSKIAKVLREKGLVDEADQYDNKNMELASKADTAKEKFLKTTVQALDLAGSVANATKNAMEKDPANADAYWNQFAMQAKMYGLDEQNQIGQTPPQMRAGMLQKIIDQSEDGKERSKTAIEAMRIKARADRDTALNAIREKRIESQNKNAAASREIQSQRLAFQEGKFEFTTLDNHIKDQIKDAEVRKTGIDKDLSNLEKSLLELQKGNMFYTASGRPMSSDDPEVLANEAATLQEAIKAKQDEKRDLDNFVNDLNTERNSLTKHIPNKKIDTSKEFKTGVKYKFTAGANPDDIKVYQEQMAAAKTHDDKIRIQQKAFEYGLVEPK